MIKESVFKKLIGESWRQVAYTVLNHAGHMMNVVYKRDTISQTHTEGNILKILAYFSIFQHPLSAAEIKNYLPPGTCNDIAENALEQLVSDGVIFRVAEFYSISNETAWVKKRRDGNMRAAQLLPKAIRIGRFLAKFPFVTGVGISGSLSKMYADEKTDIDFFIITRTNRLWIARTIMHLFKKLTFITRTQHYYCMNYYIDEKALALHDHDIYTAIETATLVPAGGTALADFFAVNDWVGNWFASYGKNQETVNARVRRSWITKLPEKLLQNKAGDNLDTALMKWTTHRWQKKMQKGKRNIKGAPMDLIAGRHFTRSNPGMFREMLLRKHNEILLQLHKRYPCYPLLVS